MSATETMSSMPAAATSYFQPIIATEALQNKQDDEPFDAGKHMAYKPPPEVIKMTDIGYSEDTGVSPVAVSQPFQLFSEEAVQRMRSEIFRPEVMEKYRRSSNLAACQLRGIPAKDAPFVHDAWHDPEVLKVISDIAGVDLIPTMDYEVSHVNVSVKSEEQTKNELHSIEKQRKFFDEDEGIAGCPWEDDKPVVGWHTDSYPFVCVLMLSDCTDMVGGETALRTSNGDILKVRGPGMGCAVVLQGRYIYHQALRALGSRERITLVTSFRPRDPHLREDSVLESVRPISDLPELYYQFGEYRLEILEERIRHQLKKMRTDRCAGRKFQTEHLKRFLDTQEAFVRHTNQELVENRKVSVGFIEQVKFDTDAGTEDPSDAKRQRVD